MMIFYLEQPDLLEVTDTPIGFYHNQVYFMNMCLTFKRTNNQLYSISVLVTEYEYIAICDLNKYTMSSI